MESKALKNVAHRRAEGLRLGPAGFAKGVLTAPELLEAGEREVL